MSRGVKLSVLGMYHWDDSLFSEMVYPSQFTSDEKQTVVQNILAECAELEILFPDWGILKSMIGLWSKLELPVWQRIYTAALKEYNPIENYNRTETETNHNARSETHSGSDGVLVTGSTTESHSGTDANQNSVTGYDSNSLVVHDKTELTHGESITTGGSTGTTTTHGEVITNDDYITRENHTTGNIGVTTSQQMLEQEIEVAAKLNVMRIIVESFKERFCILVY